MSRTNKGGARLRLVIGATGVMAIAAGVYAGLAHPMTNSCDIVPTAIKEGGAVRITCSMDNSALRYELAGNGDGVWNSSSSGSGLGTSPGDCIGMSTPYVAPLHATSIDLYFCTSTSGGTVADTEVKLRRNDTHADLVDSDSVNAYNLSFTNSTLSATHGDPVLVRVQGLVGTDAVKFGEVNSSGVPGLLKFDSASGGSGSGTVMSNFILDSSSPYLTPSTISASGGSIASDVYIKSSAGASAGQTYLGVYLNGVLIGQTPQITIN